MTLQETSEEIINQLINVTAQLSNEEFSLEVEVLSGNTIGKHIRHIIEFYDCLLRGYGNNCVDYDERERNLLLETDKSMAIDEMGKIIKSLQLYEDRLLKLSASYGTGEKQHQITSFNRELVYNIEHAIHHMAIIKITIMTEFKDILVPKNFGVAHSTIQYQEKQCAQ